MSYYANPTASMAIRAVEQELCLMRIKARHIKALKEKGRLTTEDLELARKQFIGIYRKLLVEALSDKPKKKTASRRCGKPSCLLRISFYACTSLYRSLMRTLSIWLMGVTLPSNLCLKEAVPAPLHRAAPLVLARTGAFICQLFTFWKMTAGS